CQTEFSYHRSSSSLSYHLNAKHPTESSPRLDGRQPTLYDFSSKITRPVREKVTNVVAVWVAGDCRPINIVEDGGLTEVFRIASGDNSYDLPSRGTIVFKKKNTIKQRCLKYTLYEVITRSFIRCRRKKPFNRD